MPTVVIPFAGVEGKTRLHASRRARRALSLAMLGDVLAAALAVGEPRLVTADDEAAAIAGELGAEVAAIRATARGRRWRLRSPVLDPGPILIVNADVPCVVPDDLRALLAATPAGGIALVEALDGTTNALGLSAAEAFAPLYGPDSASRFRAHAHELGLEAVSVAVPNLADDVDTIERPAAACSCGCGPRTQACLFELPVGATRVKIVIFSGGVGGARFVRSVVDVVEPADVTVIGNVGDDVEVLGMHVSPDLDSVLYALAGLNDEERGWGRSGETWNALESVAVARRRGMVRPGRPRPRPASRPHAGVARRGAALGGNGAHLLVARRDDAPAACHRRSVAHVDRHRGRRVPVPGMVRRARTS